MPKAKTPKIPGPKKGKFDDIKRERFLELLKEGGRRLSTCQAIGIDYKTFQRAMELDPAFGEAVSMAEATANEVIENALYESAKGYWKGEGEQRRYYPGNVTAQQVWLYNRNPEKWKDARNRIELANADPNKPFAIVISGPKDGEG